MGASAHSLDDAAGRDFGEDFEGAQLACLGLACGELHIGDLQDVASHRHCRELAAAAGGENLPGRQVATLLRFRAGHGATPPAIKVGFGRHRQAALVETAEYRRSRTAAARANGMPAIPGPGSHTQRNDGAKRRALQGADGDSRYCPLSFSDGRRRPSGFRTPSAPSAPRRLHPQAPCRPQRDIHGQGHPRSRCRTRRSCAAGSRERRG